MLAMFYIKTDKCWLSVFLSGGFIFHTAIWVTKSIFTNQLRRKEAWKALTVLLRKRDISKWPLDGAIYLKLFYSSWWSVGTIFQETRQGLVADPVGQSYSWLWWAGRLSCHGNPEWSCHWLWAGLGCVHQRWGWSCGHLQISPSLL